MNDAPGPRGDAAAGVRDRRAASPSWSDEDRRWADRVALEAVGRRGAADVFIAERAHHAMHRLLAARAGAGAGSRAAPRLGALVVAVVAAVAFGLGLLADPIGASQRINLLTPPLWGVLRGTSSSTSPARRAAARGWRAAADGARRADRARPGASRMRRGAAAGRRRAAGGGAAALARFAPLWAARSARARVAARADAAARRRRRARARADRRALPARPGARLPDRLGEHLPVGADRARRAHDRARAGGALSGIALPDAAGFAALQARPGDAAAARRRRRGSICSRSRWRWSSSCRARCSPPGCAAARWRSAALRAAARAAVLPAPGAAAARQRRRDRRPAVRARRLAAGDARPAGAARRGVRPARRVVRRAGDAVRCRGRRAAAAPRRHARTRSSSATSRRRRRPRATAASPALAERLPPGAVLAFLVDETALPAPLRRPRRAPGAAPRRLEPLRRGARQPCRSSPGARGTAARARRRAAGRRAAALR